jgi:Protein of unknown function (DUF2752)
MTFSFKKISAGDIDLGIIFGSITLAALGAARLFPVTSLMPSCVFKELTGIPCPACGSTRAVMHFAHFDVPHAFIMNPLIAAAVVLSLLALIYSIVSAVLGTPKIKVSLSTREGNILRIGVILAVSVQWLYLYLQH